MPHLEVHNICKSYPDGWALEGVSFAVEQGESICLLGPSGSGKTTLLRLIAGLERPDCGQVMVDGQDISHVPPHRRGFGMMFQEYALFPHRDVFANVAFGLRMQRQDRDYTAERVTEVLELVDLAGFEHRDVNQLSGGERQRVALARSLAPHPTLLMLDEPLGALDRALREHLMVELPRILRRAQVTTLMVTHDQEEAFAIADRVILMRDGHIVQMGAPQEVYRRPATSWVARFFGLTNLVDARLVDHNRVSTPMGTFEIDRPVDVQATGAGSLHLLIRPEAARRGNDGPNIIRAQIERCSFRGDTVQISVRHPSGIELTFSLPATVELPEAGESIDISLNPRSLTLLPSA